MSDFYREYGKFVIITVLALFALGCFWGYGSYRNTLKSLDRKASAAKAEIEQLSRLLQEYRVAATELRTLGPVSESGNDNLIATVERAAQEADARSSLIFVRPQPDRAHDGFVEEGVEIRLEQLQLQQLVALLYYFETQTQQLKVRQLRVRTRFDDPDRLDTVMTLSRVVERS